MQSNQQEQSYHTSNRCVTTIIRPMRIFQFLVTLSLFALIICMLVMDPMPMSIVACILLITLSGVYVFILTVDLISQFGGTAIHIMPMLTFSLFGVLFYGIAAILLISNAYTLLPVQITALILCVLAASLFLIDIAMILTFWKRRCSTCKRCCYNDTVELLLRKYNELRSSDHEQITKCDVTTSVSDIQIPLELEDFMTPDHCYRKIEYPRRREYVDCPTCVPSLCNIGVAQVQTESRRLSVTESQTPRTSMKETPMQTLSKCEMCDRRMLSFTPPIEGAICPSVPQATHLPQWTSYPAIVQFVRGGISVPCCPGCKCAMQQPQQQPLYVTPEQLEVQIPEANGRLTSEAQQVTNSVVADGNDVATRTEVPIAVPRVSNANKRIRIASNAYANAVYKPAVTTKIKDAKRPSEEPPAEDVNQKLAKEIIPLKEEKIDEITVEPESEEAKEAEEIPEEQIPVLEEYFIENQRSLPDEEEGIENNRREETIGNEKEPNNSNNNFKNDNKTITRTKAGGEEGIKISQQYESPKHTMATQMSPTRIKPSNSRTRSRTLLKPNKVDPMNDTDVSDENRMSDRTERGTPRGTYTNQGDKLTESLNPVERRGTDVCSHCKCRKNITPSSDNSRYYNTFQDKWGRYFCEFCAPLDSKKVYNRLEIKKARCTNCKFSLFGRSGGNKADVCPKCGQSQ